jgi:hypothetical protein
VQQSGGATLLFGAKGGGKPAGLLCHASQVVTEKLRNARPFSIGAMSEKLIVANVFLAWLHRFLLVASTLGVYAAVLATHVKRIENSQ